jgi:predicted NBD/HSP70 family sugar kinase
MTRSLAIDLGGTVLRAAVGEPRELSQLAREPSPGNLAQFRARLESLLADAGEVEGLGLAVPGLVDGTRCRWVPNLPYLDGIDLAEWFPGLRIGLGNDAQFALLAEVAVGRAIGLTDALLVAIGTGIGSAVLSGGRILTGAQGGACSFGWICADLADLGEDRSGWLERVSAGRALDALALKHGHADGAELVAAARGGDQVALAALAAPARALGVSLAGAVALLDPQMVLLVGGVAEAFDLLRASLLEAMRRQLPPHLRTIDVQPGSFGAQASLVGAAFAGAVGPGWRNLR